MYERYLKEEMI